MNAFIDYLCPLFAFHINAIEYTFAHYSIKRQIIAFVQQIEVIFETLS